MSSQTQVPGTASGQGPQEKDAPTDASITKQPAWYSVSNIGAVYVWILIVALFWMLSPQLFPTGSTASTILNGHAITGLVALSLIVPMSAGVFDLSVAHTAGFASIMVARLLASTGMSPALAILATLLLVLAIGVVNGLVVVTFRIHSFIGTLATSSVIAALIVMVSGGRNVSSPRLLGSFGDLARWNVVQVTLPVFVMLAVAGGLWYLHQHTPTGRYLYATGFNRETARLNGIHVDRLRFVSLLVSAFVAGVGGILLTARVTTGSPTIGPPYLLPAFAAAFVGATQLKAGRFNAWGTVIAVLMLGTGLEGLKLAGAPVWASDVFVGATLIIALGVTGMVRRTTHLLGQ